MPSITLPRHRQRHPTPAEIQEIFEVRGRSAGAGGSRASSTRPRAAKSRTMHLDPRRLDLSASRHRLSAILSPSPTRGRHSANFQMAAQEPVWGAITALSMRPNSSTALILPSRPMTLLLGIVRNRLPARCAPSTLNEVNSRIPARHFRSLHVQIGQFPSACHCLAVRY
jgi:hypothetical protein